MTALLSIPVCCIYLIMFCRPLASLRLVYNPFLQHHNIWWEMFDILKSDFILLSIANFSQGWQKRESSSHWIIWTSTWVLTLATTASSWSRQWRLSMRSTTSPPSLRLTEKPWRSTLNWRWWLYSRVWWRPPPWPRSAGAPIWLLKYSGDTDSNQCSLRRKTATRSERKDGDVYSILSYGKVELWG